MSARQRTDMKEQEVRSRGDGTVGKTRPYSPFVVKMKDRFNLELGFACV